jgi:hypothetical protein
VLEVTGEITVLDVLHVADKEFLLPAFAVMFTVVYFSLALFYLTRVRRRRAEREFRLLRSISTGLSNGQVDSVDDLVNVYRGITNTTTDDDVSYKAAVSRVLRRILVSLASDPEPTDQKHRLKFKIKALLAQIEAETPFADLPAAERNLVIDARRFIEGNELQAAKQKVEDLANLIEARQDAYEKLQSANKWAVPLAVIGMVLTVVFGVMSLR